MTSNNNNMKVIHTWYYQNGKRVDDEDDFGYFYFNKDGTIQAEGTDPRGPWKMTGRCEGEFILITVNNLNRNSFVYYAGKMDGNVMNQYYNFNDNTFQSQIQKVQQNEFNAGLEFNKDDYVRFRSHENAAVFNKTFYKTQVVDVSVSRENVLTSFTTTSQTITTTNNTSSQAPKREENLFKFKKYISMAIANSMKNHSNSSYINLKDLTAERDPDFKEIKEYILLKPIFEHKTFDTICAARLSEVEREAENQNITIKKKLYSAVILDNKDKIVNILNDEYEKVDLMNADQLMNRLNQYLIMLADEIMELSESFEKNVINRISQNRANQEDLEELQIFIRSILNEKNEPKLKDIGNNEELKKKYIRLAVFLLQFTPKKGKAENYTGISAYLKQHLQRIIELRNKIVVCLTQWIQYLVRDIFSYICGLENVKVDWYFLNSLSMEYGISEKTITEMKLQYETQLRSKEERILILEKENLQLREALSCTESGAESMNQELISKYETQLNTLTERLTISERNVVILTENIRVLEQNISQYESDKRRYLLEISNLRAGNGLEQSVMTNITNNTTITVTKEVSSRYEKQILDLTRRYEDQLNELRRENILLNSKSSDLTIQRETLIIETQRKHDVMIASLRVDYEKQISDLTRRYDDQLNDLRRQITVFNSQKIEVNNVRETVIIETQRKHDVMIASLRGDYEKKISELNYANQELVRKYKLMEATYMNRITDLLKKSEEDIVEAGCEEPERYYVWTGSQLDTEKEEKIKYIERDLPVPTRPRVMEVERLVTNVVEVKVPEIIDRVIIKEKPIPVKEVVEKVKIVELTNNVDRPFELVTTEERIKTVEVIREVEKLVTIVEVHEKIKEVEVIREVMVPKIEYKEVEKIVYVDRPYPITEIREVIKTVEVKVPEIIIQEREVIRLVEVPTTDKVEILKPYEVEKPVPLIETVVKAVDRTKYVDKPVVLVEKLEVAKPVDRIVEVEKMVVAVDKQEVLKPVDVITQVDRVEYLENINEIIKNVERPIVVREFDTQIKQINVDTPYRVTEYKEVERLLVKLIEVRPEEAIVESGQIEEIEIERLLCNVVEINNTEIIRQTIKEKYETYINTLRDTITKFQTEWDTLYESYQNLLGDIKKLIINNERLKALVLELEGRIESHNQQVIGNDISIKQQIEVLTRQSLSKKTIDWNSQKEVINRTGAEMEAINSKVKRMEMKEFSSSSILASVTDDMESFTKANRTTVVTTSTITAGEITDQGYTMNSYVSGNSSHLLRNSNIVQSSYVTNEVYSNNIPANNTVSFTTTTTTNGNTFTRFVDK